MQSDGRNRFTMIEENTYQDLSNEWIELIKEAMGSNVTKEEFRAFLQKEQNERLLRKGR